MTELKEKFLALAQERESLVERLKATNEELTSVMSDIGVGTFLQGSDGLVYKIEAPKGRFVEFKTIDYVRTKKETEDRGSLSKKAAEEAIEQGLVK